MEPPRADWCEHACVTSQGHLPAQFARACERGNYMVAVALAAELKPLSLLQALDLLPLIAEHEPEKYEAAAVRLAERFGDEPLERLIFLHQNLHGFNR